MDDQVKKPDWMDVFAFVCNGITMLMWIAVIGIMLATLWVMPR